MNDVLRTPAERFKNLDGFSFSPQYLDELKGYEGLRMHYVDEGPPNAQNVFLCLHGEPTWSYLYRKMIPVFTASGHRAVAPDYFGFGRSDKPVSDDVYQFDFHRMSLMAFIESLDLNNIILVCQDWGGLLGLTLPMDISGRVSKLIVMNTALGTGDMKLSDGFVAWRKFVKDNPDFDVAGLMKRACPTLTVEECAAYDAPFPDLKYKAGVRRFPAMVPDSPDAPGAALSRKARDWLKTDWSGETFMAIGMQDAVLGPPVMNNLRKLIKGCPAPYEIPEAGHFVQEWGDVVAKRALEAFDL
ncbi:Haloalkane dehalogenase (EC [Olavius sp. associated proteobacterium Delta 1]|nr:Haloalkane dehalogenase (EC [Olavius sp. associated proteobacterium Delta 1]